MDSRRYGHATFAIVLVGAMAVSSAGGQDASGTTDASLQRAVSILDAAIVVAGGPDGVLGLRDLSFERIRRFHRPGQDPRPDSVEFAEGVLEVTIDLVKRRSSVVNQSTMVDGFHFHTRSVFDAHAGTGFTANLNLAGAGGLARSSGGPVQASWNSWNRTFPPLALRQAMDRRATLRYIGHDALAGHLHDVIGYVDAMGEEVRLYIHAEDGLLTRIETRGTDAILGDQVTATTYSEFQTIGGLLVPHRSVTKQSGQVIDESIYRHVALNQGIEDGVFGIPAAFTEPPPSIPLVGMDRLADGVYLAGVTSGYRSLVVEFEDYVVVIEAPVNSEVGQALLNLVNETIPGKPIRYVVPTHHHSDHLGGIRPFIAAGITVLTTPGNEDLIRGLPDAPHAIAPDLLAQSRIPARVETFTGRRILAGASVELHLIDVGPLRHAREMVIAYLPAQRMLFQGDILFHSRVDANHRRVLASPDARALARSVRELGLRVDFVHGVHGLAASLADLNRTVTAPDGWLIISDPG